MSDTKSRAPDGVFFEADDPAAPAAWYARHLGFGIESGRGMPKP